MESLSLYQITEGHSKH